jgi:hypothetical protein
VAISGISWKEKLRGDDLAGIGQPYMRSRLSWIRTDEVMQGYSALTERDPAWEVPTRESVAREHAALNGEVWFSLAECPFVGREHEGMNVGKGKTAIRLNKTEGKLGFSCFAGPCSEHTISQLMARYSPEALRREYLEHRERGERPLTMAEDVCA